MATKSKRSVGSKNEKDSTQYYHEQTTASIVVNVSMWRPDGSPLSQDLYFANGIRVDYFQLPKEKKIIVRKKRDQIVLELFKRLKNKTVAQVIDNNIPITIIFTRKGLEHFCRDAMMTLSGKYFSEKSMMRIDDILAQSTYIPTSHTLQHQRTDGRDLWFTYKDNEGKGVYFKVGWNKNIKKYEFYSVVDKL